MHRAEKATVPIAPVAMSRLTAEAALEAEAPSGPLVRGSHGFATTGALGEHDESVIALGTDERRTDRMDDSELRALFGPGAAIPGPSLIAVVPLEERATTAMMALRAVAPAASADLDVQLASAFDDPAPVPSDGPPIAEPAAAAGPIAATDDDVPASEQPQVSRRRQARREAIQAITRPPPWRAYGQRPRVSAAATALTAPDRPPGRPRSPLPLLLPLLLIVVSLGLATAAWAGLT